MAVRWLELRLLAAPGSPPMSAAGYPEFSRRGVAIGTHKVASDRAITDMTHLFAKSSWPTEPAWNWWTSPRH